MKIVGPARPVYMWPLRKCTSVKCDADVIDALVVGPTSNKPVTIDPEPTTWDKGGRFKLRGEQAEGGKKPLLVRATHAGQAFGAVLFAEHKLSCAGGSGVRTRSREADG